MKDLIQGSDEWKQARIGSLGASRVADALATVKSGGWGASRANYAAELVIERLTGAPYPQFVSQAMLHGTENEPKARALYEFQTGYTVEQVGLIKHPRIPRAHASPDGFVGADGLVEIKAPNSSTHLKTLRTKSIPFEYLQQITWQMAVTNRLWCDFVSFDPRLPEPMQLYVQRALRDETKIHKMEQEVKQFLADIELEVSAYRREYGLPELEAA